MTTIGNHRKSSAAAHRVPGPLPVRRWTRRIVTVSATSILTFGMAVASAAPALASGWSIQSTPDLSGPAQGAFDGVSCTGTACVAVGDYVDTADTQVPLVADWNGAAWAMQQGPALPGGGVLDGVSCTATACTAVGDYIDSSGTQLTLAEVWNGTSWSIQSTPTIAGASRSVLYDVSCTSPNACTAVGNYLNSSGTGQLLAEAWNGTAWTIEAITTPASGGDLTRVSCSSATACTALGQSSGTTLVERWNGNAWASQTLAVPTSGAAPELYGVTCTAANLCTGVGHWSRTYCKNGQPTCNCFKSPGCTTTQSTLAEDWNGSAWAIESTPGTGVLDGVSCPTATDCSAVGFGSGATVAEQWNGSSWSAQTIPNPGYGSGLQQVSCTAAAACIAVGNGNGAALAEGWNGTSWSIQAAPTPAGPATSRLSQVSCTAAAACTAVGSSTNASGTEVTLAEAWNGSSWLPQTTLNPAGATGSSLSGVSCFTTSSCTAVGAESTGGGNPPPDLALAEAWNGSSWSIQPTPSLGAGYDTVLSGVACTGATLCMSVGYDYYNQGPQDAVLAEQLNGSSWTLAPPQIPAGAYTSVLSSVSCATSAACTTVGTWDNNGVQQPLAEQWNGTAWAIQTSPVPAGALSSGLSSVSCATSTACMAVGVWSNNGVQQPLAEQWNGTAWVIQTVPTPTSASASYLSGVSCVTATDCTAVGHYTTTSVQDVTLAEQWDGATWTIQPTPNPPGGANSYLFSVSCTAATACTAVGSSANATLAERYSG